MSEHGSRVTLARSDTMSEQITVQEPRRGGTTPADGPRSGPGLAKAAVAAKADGEWIDLDRPLDHDVALAIVVPDSDDGREVLRHSTAHVLAEAVTRLFPGAKYAIGPAIADGFYYDFELPDGQTFSEDDLGEDRGRDARDREAGSALRARGAVVRRRAEGVRRPALQARDHREGPRRRRRRAKTRARPAATAACRCTATS